MIMKSGFLNNNNMKSLNIEFYEFCKQTQWKKMEKAVLPSSSRWQVTNTKVLKSHRPAQNFFPLFSLCVFCVYTKQTQTWRSFVLQEPTRELWSNTSPGSKGQQSVVPSGCWNARGSPCWGCPGTRSRRGRTPAPVHTQTTGVNTDMMRLSHL